MTLLYSYAASSNRRVIEFDGLLSLRAVFKLRGIPPGHFNDFSFVTNRQSDCESRWKDSGDQRNCTRSNLLEPGHIPRRFNARTGHMILSNASMH